jgi:hypothetical protein
MTAVRQTPDEFRLVESTNGTLFLTCTDTLAASFAVRIVHHGQATIGQRVPTDALRAIPDAPRDAVAWFLGVTNSDRASWTVYVHRPFGPLVEI